MLKIPVLAILLLGAQALFVHWAGGAERPPAAPELGAFPSAIGKWRQISEDPIEDAVKAQLGADRLLSRTYVEGADGAMGNVLVAWFQSQRAGARQPHSPKVCLPGAGWIPEVTGEIDIPTADGLITVNRYVVAQKQARAVVLYWYQTPRRVTAGEWASKFWVAADALRDRRTDTSLVRLLVWSTAGGDEQATVTGVRMAQELYPLLRQRLPGL